MPARWTIRDEFSWKQFCDYVGRQRLAGKRPTFEEVPEKRSLDQNSLSHSWYAEVSRAKEDISPLEAKCESKLHCGVPILRTEDDGFREFYDASIKPTLTYEKKLEAMKFLPVTSLMSKKQLSQYLEDMQQYWGRQGVYLAFPEDYQRTDYPEATA